MRNHRYKMAAFLTALLACRAGLAASPAFQLLDMLAGDDDQARARARQLLPREDVEVVPRLVVLLGNDKEPVRLAAYHVLADFANQVSVAGREADRAKVTESLMTLLRADRPHQLKEQGLRLLSLVAAEGTDLGPIAALLDDDVMQEKARAALVEMGTTQARAALRERIAGARPEFAIALLNGLVQLKDSASLEVAVQAAASEHAGVRAAAARAMAWTGDPSRLVTVRQVLARSDEATRAEATDAWLRLVRAMELNGGNWQIVATEYQSMLASDDAKVRVAGLAGLGRLGDGACVGPILGAMQAAPGATQAAGGGSLEWAAGIEALRQMQGVDVCREIVNAWSSVPAGTRLALLPVLAGKQHAMVVPILTEAAGSADPAFRTAAIAALGELGLPEAIEPLAAVVKGGTAEDKARARDTLVRLGDALRSGRHAAAAGDAYQAALSGGPVDKTIVRKAIAALATVPTARMFEVAQQAADDPELKDVALPLLIATGDKLAADKANDKAEQLFRRAIELGPDSATLRAIADRMLRLGKPIDWAASLGIIRQWSVVGPFELGEQNAGWNKPYVDEPNVNLKGKYMSDKRRLEWRPAVADEQRGVVNLAGALGQVDNAIGYAYAEIVLPAATEAVLRIGADDSERVWVNGTQVFELWAARGLTIDQDRVPVKLNAGRNTILLKVWQNSMGWEFCVRVTTPDDRPVAFEQ